MLKADPTFKETCLENFTDHVHSYLCTSMRRPIAFFHLASEPDNLNADERILKRSRVMRCDDGSEDTSYGSGNCNSEILL